MSTDRFFPCLAVRPRLLFVIACLVWLNNFPGSNGFVLPLTTFFKLPRTGLGMAPGRSGRDTTLKGLNVAVVGAGPSGLLLTHQLLKEGASVSLYEARTRPRPDAKDARAYALGLGRRGRTAIRSVDEGLWRAVCREGFRSERFILHVGPLRLKLRDAPPAREEADGDQLEPSLLLFQTDLCRALADELHSRYDSMSQYDAHWSCKVSKLNLESRRVESDGGRWGPYNLIVGCDGVNSSVRKAIQDQWSTFESKKQSLPGQFKVVRLAACPPKLDPTAVSLILPKSGKSTAFFEPTAGGNCCVLFAGRAADDEIMSSQNATLLEQLIPSRFPLLAGGDVASMAEQLSEQATPSQAYSVECNTYHYADKAVLVGDAAHATGGTSGQGVNSALVDSMVLSRCLVESWDASKKQESVAAALLAYSQLQVPEGKALYDLSFGPVPRSPFRRLVVALKQMRDAVFGGRYGIGHPQLQTTLTTSLTSFADVRRARGDLYESTFPDADWWNATIAGLAAKAMKQTL